MNDSLSKQMLSFAKNSKELVSLCKKREQQTKNSLVEPYLKMLNYDPSNPLQVRAEYQTSTVRNADRVDYALMEGDRPIAFVEAKSLSHRDLLNKSGMNKQLRSYMLDSASAKFGALTDGQWWHWYYRDLSQYEPVLFLVADTFAESQDRSVVEWNSLLKTREPVNKLLTVARSISMASRLSKWLEQSRSNPTDSLARFLLKEIGEKGANKDLLDLCKRSWLLAANNAMGDSQPNAPEEPNSGPSLSKSAVMTPKKSPTKPVYSGDRSCVLQFSNGKREKFPDATLLMIGIIRYCVEQHTGGQQDYYQRVRRPVPTRKSWPVVITEEEYQSDPKNWTNYSYKSENGYHIFRNLSNQSKVRLIELLLSECSLASGDSPRIGRDIFVHLPNSSLQLHNVENEI